MKILSNNIAFFLFQKGVIKKEEEEIYAYGAEIAMIYLISMTTYIVIGFICNQLMYGVVFTFLFMGLRGAAGGYHASTRLRCYIISTCLYMVILAAVFLVSIEMKQGLFLPILLFSNIVLVLTAPSQNLTNPRTHSQLKENKRKMLCYLAVLDVFSLISWGLREPYFIYFIVAETLMAVAVFSLINYYQNFKRRSWFL